MIFSLPVKKHGKRNLLPEERQAKVSETFGILNRYKIIALQKQNVIKKKFSENQKRKA